MQQVLRACVRTGVCACVHACMHAYMHLRDKASTPRSNRLHIDR